MDELSLHILDIAKNSLEASAALVEIGIDEAPERLVVTIADDGCGMSEEALKNAPLPGFTTKRGGRGLGLASIKLACELSGGELTVSSKAGNEHHTLVRAKPARARRYHIDDSNARKRSGEVGYSLYTPKGRPLRQS